VYQIDRAGRKHGIEKGFDEEGRLNFKSKYEHGTIRKEKEYTYIDEDYPFGKKLAEKTYSKKGKLIKHIYFEIIKSGYSYHFLSSYYFVNEYDVYTGKLIISKKYNSINEVIEEIDNRAHKRTDQILRSVRGRVKEKNR
jgi:hypothetical protein